MATTTNYSWTTPDDTALVKDGAAAIRSLGTAIDTTVFNNASAAIAKTIVDAKGDIIAATAADTVSRLAVGANDTVLTADSSTATGLKWAAPGGAGANFTLLNSGGTALSGSQTITVSGISGKDQILVIVRSGASSVETGRAVSIRINGDTGSNYYTAGLRIEAAGTYNSGNINMTDITGTGIILCYTSGTASQEFAGSSLITGCNSSGVKAFNGFGGSGGGGGAVYGVQGIWDNSATVSSVSVFCESGNFDAGRVYVYTSA